MTFAASCLLGLEGLVANELRFQGIEGVRAENGRVLFEGDLSAMVRANICSRLAQRVTILLSEFDAFDFDTLFEGVRAIEWSDYIGVKDSFPVKGSCVSSALSSVPACQKIIKKAIVEKLKGSYGVSWFDETGVSCPVRFLILKNRVSVMLDTSGEPLNKRGYRAVSNEAPLKETLAAAMAELARVRANHTVVDPFCGSGTILIEAAMKAINRMPGLSRSFLFEDFGFISPDIVKAERERALSLERPDASFMAYGYDISDECVELTRSNAEKAGVSDRIVLEKRDIADFSPEFDRCSVITNPPYGERMLDLNSARDIYRVMGKVFEPRPYYSYTVISPDDEFEKLFGRTADKKRKLYNGMIKCNVYMYYTGKAEVDQV